MVLEGTVEDRFDLGDDRRVASDEGSGSDDGGDLPESGDFVAIADVLDLVENVGDDGRAVEQTWGQSWVAGDDLLQAGHKLVEGGGHFAGQEIVVAESVLSYDLLSLGSGRCCLMWVGRAVASFMSLATFSAASLRVMLWPPWGWGDAWFSGRVRTFRR